MWSSKEGRCTCRTECKRPGKHPIGYLVPRGLLDATQDQDQVISWWVTAPWANIGLVANSDFWVLDVDAGHGGCDSLAKLESTYGALPATVQSRTGGGGLHLFFKPPLGKKVRNTTNIFGDEFPGIDTRAGDRGYVVAPPSMHKSGQRYAWAPGRAPGEVEVAEPPQWLVERVIEKPRVRPKVAAPLVRDDITDLDLRRAQGLLDWAANEVQGAAEGERNNTLFKMSAMVGGWVGGGYLERSEAEAALEEAGEACGLDSREVQATMANGLDRGESDPQGLPDDTERKRAWMIERGLLAVPLSIEELRTRRARRDAGGGR